MGVTIANTLYLALVNLLIALDKAYQSCNFFQHEMQVVDPFFIWILNQAEYIFQNHTLLKLTAFRLTLNGPEGNRNGFFLKLENLKHIDGRIKWNEAVRNLGKWLGAQSVKAFPSIATAYNRLSKLGLKRIDGIAYSIQQATLVNLKERPHQSVFPISPGISCSFEIELVRYIAPDFIPIIKDFLKERYAPISDDIADIGGMISAIQKRGLILEGRLSIASPYTLNSQLQEIVKVHLLNSKLIPDAIRQVIAPVLEIALVTAILHSADKFYIYITEAFDQLCTTLLTKLANTKQASDFENIKIFNKHFQAVLIMCNFNEIDSVKKILSKINDLTELLISIRYDHPHQAIKAWQLEALHLNQGNLIMAELREEPELYNEFQKILNSFPITSLVKTLSTAHNTQHFPTYDSREEVHVFASLKKLLDYYNYIFSSELKSEKVEAIIKEKTAHSFTILFISMNQEQLSEEKCILHYKEIGSITFTLITDPTQEKMVLEIRDPDVGLIRIKSCELKSWRRFQLAQQIFNNLHVILFSQAADSEILFKTILRSAKTPSTFKASTKASYALTIPKFGIKKYRDNVIHINMIDIFIHLNTNR